jgi:hypothetical protein
MAAAVIDGVLSLDLRTFNKPKNRLQDRHFGASERRVSESHVNDPGYEWRSPAQALHQDLLVTTER